MSKSGEAFIQWTESQLQDATTREEIERIEQMEAIYYEKKEDWDWYLSDEGKEKRDEVKESLTNFFNMINPKNYLHGK